MLRDEDKACITRTCERSCGSTEQIPVPSRVVLALGRLSVHDADRMQHAEIPPSSHGLCQAYKLAIKEGEFE